MARVALRDVTKHFGGVTAVDHLRLEVEDGELLVLLGPSGCGKTTALRIVAGLERADEGDVLIGDDVVNDIEPRDRDVAMVFQSYALYPHLSVGANIEFPLRRRGADRDERRRRVAEVAATLGLADLVDRKPGQLSGGQRQRVALGRAIVRDPKAFLMDEPLSNLDAALRQQTRADIVALQRRLGTTTLYVTHDQVEAMTMGHRIAVMSAGILQQVAPPQELYDRPANTFVAGFVGTPGMNLVPGTLRVGTAPAVDVAGGEVPLGPCPAAAATCAHEPDVTVGVRAEDVALDPGGTVAAAVLLVEVLGADVHVVCRLPDGARVVVRQDNARPRPGQGEHVRLSVRPDRVHLFATSSGERLARDGGDGGDGRIARGGRGDGGGVAGGQS